MTRRRLLLFGLLAAVTGLGGWLLWPRSAITRENAAKIQIGMTLAEVEAILGGPARDDSTGPFEGEWPRDFKFDPTNPDADWHSDTVLVLVRLDGRNRVKSFEVLPVRRSDGESSLDVIRRWLGLSPPLMPLPPPPIPMDAAPAPP
jgi:hypothetical protein